MRPTSTTDRPAGAPAHHPALEPAAGGAGGSRHPNGGGDHALTNGVRGRERGTSAWLDETGFVGGDDELRAVAGAELGQQPADVGFSGGHGHVQGPGDLVVG